MEVQVITATRTEPQAHPSTATFKKSALLLVTPIFFFAVVGYARTDSSLHDEHSNQSPGDAVLNTVVRSINN